MTVYIGFQSSTNGKLEFSFARPHQIISYCSFMSASGASNYAIENMSFNYKDDVIELNIKPYQDEEKYRRVCKMYTEDEYGNELIHILSDDENLLKKIIENENLLIGQKQTKGGNRKNSIKKRNARKQKKSKK